MGIYLHTLSSIMILAVVILFVVYLRKIGLLKEENGILFSKLVTQVTLPALIFDALANSTIEERYIFMFLFMFAAELILLIIAWIAGKLMKLGSGQMGSFLLASVFGSSSLLGYALISELFPGDTAALAEATIVSELGVGFPLFTIGVMIAIYHGNTEKGKSGLLDGAVLFFKSPIFISIILGIVWSFVFPARYETVLKPLFDAIHIVSSANTFLVTLTVGVLLKFSSLRNIAWLVVAVIVIKLIISPILVSLPANTLDLKSWQMQVLILEAAMPSAMLSVVLAGRYGCDAELAAKLVFFTLIASLVTASLILRFVG